jgi:hypothetical protein
MTLRNAVPARCATLRIGLTFRQPRKVYSSASPNLPRSARARFEQAQPVRWTSLNRGDIQPPRAPSGALFAGKTDAYWRIEDVVVPGEDPYCAGVSHQGA